MMQNNLKIIDWNFFKFRGNVNILQELLSNLINLTFSTPFV